MLGFEIPTVKHLLIFTQSNSSYYENANQGCPMRIKFTLHVILDYYSAHLWYDKPKVTFL